MGCVCVIISTPLVFIAGSHGVKPSQPTQGTNGETRCALVEAVGPTGQVGRPAWATNRPQLLLAGCLGPPYRIHIGVGLS